MQAGTSPLSLILLAAVCLTPTSHAQDPWLLSHPLDLLAGHAVNGDIAGTAVATRGEISVLGAPRHDHGAFVDRGAAFVDRRGGNGWTHEQELLPDVDGNTLVVGCRRHDGLCPGNHRCRLRPRPQRLRLGQSTTLTSSDLEDADRFGAALRLEGDTLVVGAVGDRESSSGTGAVYVFQRVGGIRSQSAKLLASDRAERTEFGSSLSLSGDPLAVGTHLDDGGTFWDNDSGATHGFRRGAGGWSEEAKLRASDVQTNMRIGRSVSVDGGRVAVGAPGANAPSNSSGSVYLFEAAGGAWTQTAKLTHPGALQFDRFGSSVGLRGGALVSGLSPNTGSGAAHVVHETSAGWTHVQGLADPGGPRGRSRMRADRPGRASRQPRPFSRIAPATRLEYTPANPAARGT